EAAGRVLHQRGNRRVAAENEQVAGDHHGHQRSNSLLNGNRVRELIPGALVRDARGKENGAFHTKPPNQDSRESSVEVLSPTYLLSQARCFARSSLMPRPSKTIRTSLPLGASRLVSAW